MKPKLKPRQELVMLVVPDVKVLSSPLSMLENDLVDAPKGFSTQRFELVYHADLTKDLPGRRLAVLFCAEHHFTDEFKDYLAGVLQDKEAIYLCLHEDCRLMASMENIIFTLGGHKVRFPVRETDLSPTAPFSKLLRSCCNHYKHVNQEGFRAGLKAYQNRFQFSLSLEAAFQLVHDYSNGEKWLMEPFNGDYQNRLEQRVGKILADPQIQNALQVFPPNSMQEVDNQVFDFCEFLFNPQFLGTHHQ